MFPQHIVQMPFVQCRGRYLFKRSAVQWAVAQLMAYSVATIRLRTSITRRTIAHEGRAVDKATDSGYRTNKPHMPVIHPHGIPSTA